MFSMGYERSFMDNIINFMKINHRAFYNYSKKCDITNRINTIIGIALRICV